MKIKPRSSALFHHCASSNLDELIDGGQAFRGESVMVL